MMRQGFAAAVAAWLTLSPGTNLVVSAAPESAGALSVASDPPGAAVYVDGQFVGQTPLDVRNLQPGDHRVRLVKDGYLENGRLVTIAAGKTGSLQVRLTARTSSGALPEGQAGGGISSGGGGGPSRKWLWLGVAGAGAAATGVILATRNHAPRISGVTATPSTGLLAATTIAFTATASDDDNDSLTYSWDFGDGGTATGASTTHDYATAGTFTARVTVSDGKKEVPSTTTVTIRSLTGTWRGTMPGATPTQGTFVLTQSGSTVSGTFSDFFGPGTVTSGSMVKNTPPRVTIIVNQPPFTPYIFTGNPGSDANSITGVLNQSGFNNDPLTITRQ